MSEYRLQANEVELYSGQVAYQDAHGKSIAKGSVTLTLTNQSIVFTICNKKMFGKEEVAVESFPVTDVKIYNEAPQIKQAGTTVTLYLVSGEKYVDFFSKIEAWKFVSKATELLTGKTMAERGAGKLRNALNLVDDTLGINTVDTVKDVLENGVTGLLFGKKKK